MKLTLRPRSSHKLEPEYEDPNAAFAQLVAWFAFVRRTGESLEKKVSNALLQHPMYTVAQQRMLERLIYGVPTMIVSEEYNVTQYTNNPGPGIGCWVPGTSVLILNDRAPENWHKCDSWCFISNTKSGTAEWLANQLHSYNIPEASLYWANVFCSEIAAKGPGFVERLNPHAIYALGRNSAAWCRENGVRNFKEIHHPSYWARMHKTDKYLLPKLIAQDLGERSRKTAEFMMSQASEEDEADS